MTKTEIKAIILEQKEELESFSKKKVVKRDIEDQVEKNLQSNLIKIITGPRRAGKSTLSMSIISKMKYAYVNFDDERMIKTKTENLNELLDALLEVYPNPEILFFDEIQNIEGWELFLNRLFRQNYNILITGSNSKLLSKELSTHLTGRFLDFELMPFSFKEFLNYFEIDYKNLNINNAKNRAIFKNIYQEYLKLGGFSESYEIFSHKEYLQSLFNSIISKDIIQRYSIKYTKEIKELSLLLASIFSSKVSYNRIRNIFDIGSIHTIKKYMDYLEEAFVIFQLNRFSYKAKEQIKSNKKVYIIDTGFINALTTEIVDSHGRILENIVLLHLKRKFKEVFYANIENKHEIDFIIRDGASITQLIQVSYNLDNEKTKAREIEALIQGSQLYKTDNLYIITQENEDELVVDGKTIKILPIWKYLLD